MSRRHRYRLGCDIGGTFTDFLLDDPATGGFRVHKVLTTPDDPSAAVDAGIAELEAEIDGGTNLMAATDYLIHGTTLVINAVIQRKGARTAILTTQGFADCLEMRREIRYDIYDIGAVYPTPLIERPYRYEVPERLYADGAVRQALDEDAVRAVFQRMLDDGIESAAVVLLHAYANPAHERRVAEIAAEAAPGIAITLSSDVMPEIKEFERTSTAAVNAYVKPLVARYIARLEERLAARGFRDGLYLMLSSGGVIAPDTARAHPVRLIESGPVGGALAAARLGAMAGDGNVLMFDMGGTTAKSCLIRDGGVPIANTYEVDRVHRFKRGSGTPIGVPTVDVIEIGAGGGSIAAVDGMGLLSVGPESAGADPGPACYGRGGVRPTVTDADLVLGYLDADYFLGGAMRLDTEAARRAITRDLADPLDMPLLDAAWGVHEIVNENMAAAIRMYVTEKGGDLGGAAVVAIGGAGPVHAADFARRLGARRLLVPRGAGVYSALGFLVAPVAFEAARTKLTPLTGADAGEIEVIFETLEAETAQIVENAVPGADIGFSRAADVRYVGQGGTLRIEMPAAATPAAIESAFLAAYSARYGAAYDDMAAQIVTYRVTACAVQEQRDLTLPFAADGGLDAASKGERPAFCPERRRMVPHRVYAMDRLPAGATVAGPAIVEEDSSTLVVGAGAEIRVDGRGWLTVTLADTGAAS
ncbi:MAG: hydantoinase/oxoprolinase family protein [Magnetovibrio sp.]|nr:hydantoinase/oxoprolinase family protein [Magnetovibrio sp.]